MKFSLCTLAALALVSLSPTFIHADTTFNFAAVQMTGTASGTVILDTTTGQITGGTFSGTNDAGISETFTFSNSGVFDTVTFAFFLAASNDTFQLALPGTMLTDYAGGLICSDSNESGCMDTIEADGSYYYTGTPDNFAQSGALTPLGATVTGTPEPSSIALLGTGLFGLAGVARRRFTR